MLTPEFTIESKNWMFGLVRVSVPVPVFATGPLVVGSSGAGVLDCDPALSVPELTVAPPS